MLDSFVCAEPVLCDSRRPRPRIVATSATAKALERDALTLAAGRHLATRGYRVAAVSPRIVADRPAKAIMARDPLCQDGPRIVGVTGALRGGRPHRPRLAKAGAEWDLRRICTVTSCRPLPWSVTSGAAGRARRGIGGHPRSLACGCPPGIQLPRKNGSATSDASRPSGRRGTRNHRATSRLTLAYTRPGPPAVPPTSPTSPTRNDQACNRLRAVANLRSAPGRCSNTVTRRPSMQFLAAFAGYPGTSLSDFTQPW